MVLAETTESLRVGVIFMELLGGLALFLFGMDQMTGALKLVAGDGMKALLARLTTNRFKAVFAGTVVTAIIQSSSVTTVLVVGFISAGLMTLQQSIGVILGADIGTTITAQVVAFKITHFALIPVALGFLLQFAFKGEAVRSYGAMIMGLGLIFFGMQLMSDGTKPLRSYEPFIEMMRRMDHPLPAIIAGTLFTAIVQSSSATIGVIIVLASQGFITLEAGIALAFGANIGTCVTAILAAIGKPRDAVRAAVVHVLFKVIGVAIWLGLIGQLAWIVRWISPAAPDLDGAARLAAETPRQIANAHTVFNVVNMLLFVGFTTPLASLMRWVVPDRRMAAAPEVVRSRYLDDILLQAPALAVDTVRMELGRLGASAVHMTRSALRPVTEGTMAALDRLQAMDNEVDVLYAAIITYLGRLSQENLSDRQAERVNDYIGAANYFENIGDMIETNLVDAGRRRIESGVQMSEATRRHLQELHARTAWSVEAATRALVADDRDLAEQVVSAKDEITELANTAEQHLARRLAAHEPGRLAAYSIEAEIIESLRRIYYFAKRLAKIVIELDEPPDVSRMEGAAAETAESA